MDRFIGLRIFAAVVIVCSYFACCSSDLSTEIHGSANEKIVSCQPGQTLATFQRGYFGNVYDTEVRSASPGNNYGAQTAMNAGQVGSPPAARSVLIRFDISTIPPGSQIQSASITLTNGLAPSAGTVVVSQNLSSWIESGAGGVTFGSAPQIGASITSKTNNGAAGSAFVVDNLSSVAQGWISGSNYGLRLDEATGSSNFYASEYGTISSRPRLDICYTTTPPVACDNATIDGSETDVDCGGAVCGGCADGKSCVVGADCLSGLCYSGTCYRRGTESTVAQPACTFPGAPPIMPSQFVYGTTAAQTCDVYAPYGSSNAQTDVMIVSSGFTGGSRGASPWTLWGAHEVQMGRVGVVCDVRHAASGGVNPFPASLNDVRCIVRQMSTVASSLGGSLPVKILGGSAAGNLALHAVATADRQMLTSEFVGDADTILDADGTCPIAWNVSDVNLVSRVAIWSAPTDLRVKSKINASPQPNMDIYLNLPSGESDSRYVDRARRASPIFYLHPGQPPVLAIHGDADIVVYPEHTMGSGNVPTPRASGLIGTVPEERLDGVDATSFLVSGAGHEIAIIPPSAGSNSAANCTVDGF